ncbi:MAG: hypothetical protein IPJ77_15255, partial [Planctomycetes bacterium]|nr:hypothetical protein [Planctomycetota bacterium]
ATVALRALNADARVVLPPAHALALAAEGSEPLVEDDLRIGVFIELAEPPAGWPEGVTEATWEFFDDERRIALELAVPGRYRVHWAFAVNWAGRSDSVGDLSEDLPPPVELEVGGGGARDVRLAPPAGILERVKKRLGRP